jgi:hypothetical protein
LNILGFRINGQEICSNTICEKKKRIGKKKIVMEKKVVNGKPKNNSWNSMISIWSMTNK